MVNKKLYHTAILLLIFFLPSCNPQKMLQDHSVVFDAPFPKRSKDLSLIIGSQFMLLTEYDTLAVRVTYNKKTKLNLFRDAITGDTIGLFRVSKFHQLYYLSKQINDTSYIISAMKFRKGEIQGMGSGDFQMEKLYDEIEKGKYKRLVKYYDSNRAIYHLTFDKKQLKAFYKSIVDSTASMRIINVMENTTDIQSEDTILIGTSKDTLEESTGIVKNVFPNPATDKVNIELEDEGNYSLSLYSSGGKLVKSTKSNTDNLSVNVSDVASGTYIVIVTEKETGETTKVKILVHH